MSKTWACRWTALAVVAAGLPLYVHAQSDVAPAGAASKPVWLSIGPVTVAEGKEINGLVAIGPVTVAGTVHGDVTSFGGKIVLEKTAVVDGHVTAVCAPVEKAEGAKVAGDVNANAIPELALTPMGATNPDSLALVVGGIEVKGTERRGLVVVGGEVHVCQGADVAEVVGIGGRVQIDEGATVGSAKTIGGEIVRAGGANAGADATIAPFIGVCDQRMAGEVSPGPGRPGGGSMESSMEQSASGMRLSVACGGWWDLRASIASALQEAQFGLELQAKAAERHPVPEVGNPALGGVALQPGSVWPPVKALEIARDKDPALQHSTSVGTGIAISLAVAEGPATSQRQVRRTLRLAVPSDAASLAQEGYMGGGFGGGGFGGGLGGGLGGHY